MMRVVSELSIPVAVVLTAVSVGSARAQAPASPRRDDPPPLDGPLTDLAPIPPAAKPPVDRVDEPAEPAEMLHEALQPIKERADTSGPHVRHEPPASIVERPSGRRPALNARWVPGYWFWDSTREEFVWIGGTWQVPPPGRIWVAGRWARDADGWYRVPGQWVRRRDRGTVQAAAALGDRPAWQKTGPPATHPVDAPGVAPGPGFFFVAGHHVPDGGGVTWKPGFWARSQPGWDWIPARWVQRSEGWDYRPGYWIRDPAALADQGVPRRRTSARPVPGGLPPVAAGPEAPSENSLPGDDLRPPAPLEGDRDSMAAAERSPREHGILSDDPEFLGPITGMPYFMIRPPGYFPYGPGGVVVPGAVPPFVRRILDRVLP
jgi:hypothetical protein